MFYYTANTAPGGSAKSQRGMWMSQTWSHVRNYISISSDDTYFAPEKDNILVKNMKNLI